MRCQKRVGGLGARCVGRGPHLQQMSHTQQLPHTQPQPQPHLISASILSTSRPMVMTTALL